MIRMISNLLCLNAHMRQNTFANKTEKYHNNLTHSIKLDKSHKNSLSLLSKLFSQQLGYNSSTQQYKIFQYNLRNYNISLANMYLSNSLTAIIASKNQRDNSIRTQTSITCNLKGYPYNSEEEKNENIIILVPFQFHFTSAIFL